MLGRGVGEPDAAVGERLDEVDPPARGIRLLAELGVRRTARQTQSAVDALEEQPVLELVEDARRTGARRGDGAATVSVLTRVSDPAHEAAGIEHTLRVEPGLQAAHQRNARPGRIPYRAGFAHAERRPLTARCLAARPRRLAPRGEHGGGAWRPHAARPAARTSVTRPCPTCATAASSKPAASAVVRAASRYAPSVGGQHADGRERDRVRKEPARLPHRLERRAPSSPASSTSTARAPAARSRRAVSSPCHATARARPSNATRTAGPAGTPAGRAGRGGLAARASSNTSAVGPSSGGGEHRRGLGRPSERGEGRPAGAPRPRAGGGA